jgi:3-hydroxybutyryl-CoA dehydrogenase
MTATEIQRILVVGAGLMGSGIAEVVALAGFEVVVVDLDTDTLDLSRQRIDRSIARAVSSGRATEATSTAALARIGFSTDLAASAGSVDHVIETVVEDLAVKSAVLQQLDSCCRADVVFASNTSQFPISRLAAATKRPDRVIGSHWFNPPPVMDLIELVRGIQTSDETVATAQTLASAYGKQCVLCGKDSAGFITSRLLIALALEATRIVEEGIASAEEVDFACVKAFNHAMGPLHTLDYSGLDTALRVADRMREQYGERFLAPQQLRNFVDAGHLGRKAGKGFYEYPDPT